MLPGFRSRCVMPARCALSSALGDLDRDRQRLVERQRPSALEPAIRQRLAFEVLHHQEVDAVLTRRCRAACRCADGSAPRRRALRDRSARRSCGIGGNVLGQDLDRDGAIEAGVAGFVDLAHAAGTERRDDFVRAEASAGSQCPRRQANSFAWGQSMCELLQRKEGPDVVQDCDPRPTRPLNCA